MEVYLTPDLQAKIDQLCVDTGRAADQLVEDAMAGYIAELMSVRSMLGDRYDSMKGGSILPVNGDEFFEELRRREDALTSKDDDR